MKAKMIRLLEELIWEVLAVSVMLVGVGIKLALYDPTASGSAFFALNQRLTVSMPLAIAFGGTMVHTFMKNRHHYDACFVWVCRNKDHAVIVALRIGVIVAMIAFSWAHLEPVAFMGLQAALTLIQTLLMHAQESPAFEIKSDNPHPFADLSEIFNRMRIMARIARNRAGGHPDHFDENGGASDTLSSKGQKRRSLVNNCGQALNVGASNIGHGHVVQVITKGARVVGNALNAVGEELGEALTDPNAHHGHGHGDDDHGHGDNGHGHGHDDHEHGHH